MRTLKKYDIKYTQSVTEWDEAVPLGNGKIGSLIYGDGPLKLSVDRVDLWDEGPHPHTLEEGFNFKNLIKLSRSGKEEDWRKKEYLFEEIASGKAYPTKLTAGRIELDFGVKTNWGIDDATNLWLSVKIVPKSATAADVYIAKRGDAFPAEGKEKTLGNGFSFSDCYVAFANYNSGSGHADYTLDNISITDGENCYTEDFEQFKDYDESAETKPEMKYFEVVLPTTVPTAGHQMCRW